MLEKLRLSAWKKNPVDAEKDKDVKDVSAVTKGVKFAVSMFTLFLIGHIHVLLKVVSTQVCLELGEHF